MPETRYIGKKTQKVQPPTGTAKHPERKKPEIVTMNKGKIREPLDGRPFLATKNRRRDGKNSPKTILARQCRERRGLAKKNSPRGPVRGSTVERGIGLRPNNRVGKVVLWGDQKGGSYEASKKQKRMEKRGSLKTSSIHQERGQS